MSEPIFFMSHFRIKEGRLDTVKQLTSEVTARLQADKPHTVLFLCYIDPGRSVISFLHAFADAESMDAHFVGSDERARAAYEHIEPLGWEVYGRPSANALENLRQAADASGVALALNPEYVGGFLRLTRS
jgi:hypothetical protein